MTKMLPAAISDAFQRRGWFRGAGGDLYFNGNRTAAHPHLHLIISSINAGPRPMVGRDIRMAVCMLAYSNGAFGRTMISNLGATVNPGWRASAAAADMAPAIAAEFAWIMSYFTEG